MAIQFGGITPRSTVYDDATLNLVYPWGVHALELGARTYVFVAGGEGVSSFELDSDGSLTNIQNVSDTLAPALSNPRNFASATVDGSTYLYVNAMDYGAGVSAFQVAPNGSLANIQFITDDDMLELAGSRGEMSVAKVGSTSFLIASGWEDDGLSVFRINADGTLKNTDNVTDDAMLNLRYPSDTATAVVDDHNFVFVAGGGDNGLSVFELDSAGTLTNTFNVSDDDTLKLFGASGVATATVGDATFLIASGSYGGDSGLSVFLVNNTGTLSNVFNVQENGTQYLDSPNNLNIFTLEGETFLSVSLAGYGPYSASIFHLGTGGILSDVTSLLDTATTSISGTRGNTFATAGGVPFLVVAGGGQLDADNKGYDHGFSVFDLGSGNDILPGTSDADLLMGLGGNDTLGGAGGGDRMLGGSGDDTYLVGSGDDEVVEQAGEGNDTVRASVSYSLDVNVEVLMLLGSAGLDGTGNGQGNTLTGNAGANRLFGLGGNDLLDGAGEDDEMLGGSGDDTYLVGSGGDEVVEQAGEGNDTVRASVSYALGTHSEILVLLGSSTLTGTGNASDNTITGNAGANLLSGLEGNDALIGQEGNDTMDGGAGTDRMLGGSGDDKLSGGGGTDELLASRGRDTLLGQGGGDDFIFTSLRDSGATKATRDTIKDFGGRDDIDLSAIDAIKGRGNQAFSLDQDGDFAAGEVRLQETKAGLILEMNVDGDTKAEMSLVLKGFDGSLADGDFVF